VKGRPYIALGCDQCGRVKPTKLNERVLDARQMERVMAGRALGDLLLSTGAIEGPFKRSHPITRWRLAARRFLTALGRFLTAPRCDL
jgi:hypothetical protein